MSRPATTKPVERFGIRGEVLLADHPNDPMAGTCCICGERPEAHDEAAWVDCATVLQDLDALA
jgi:hypothetical protein